MKGQYHSPLGLITYEVIDGFLVRMFFDDNKITSDTHPDITHIHLVLNQYFHHQTEHFDIDMKYVRGTPFEKHVWDRLREIPYGKTKSYAEIAKEVGSPKACRAVGQACKKNPIGIVVPCHRVIGKDGSMTGYSGKEFVDLKKKLLEHEMGENHV